MHTLKYTILIAIIAIAATSVSHAVTLVGQADVGSNLTGDDYVLTESVTFSSGNGFSVSNGTFDGDGFTMTGTGGSVGLNVGGNATVGNVTINDAIDQGVAINGSNVVVDNVTINNAGRMGIWILGGDTIEVSNCAISGSGFLHSSFLNGILAGAGPPVSNVNIHDNSVSGSKNSNIHLTAGLTGTNFVDNNDVTNGLSIGIRIESQSNLVVSNNIISGHFNAEGIRVRGNAGNISIDGNTISNNSAEGIDFNATETAPCDITGNTVADNGSPEIFQKDIDVRGNLVRGNIHNQGSSGAVIFITRNRVDAEAGVNVVDIGPATGATFHVEHNTVRNYLDGAIRNFDGLANYNYNLITENTVQGTTALQTNFDGTATHLSNIVWNPLATGGLCDGGSKTVILKAGVGPICTLTTDNPQFISTDPFNGAFLAPGCGASNPLISNGSIGAAGDADGDGTPDCDDPEVCDGLDNDGDGQVDEGFDADGDGTADCNDGCPDDPNKIAPGDCGCGVADTDTDGDGTADCDDLCPDDPNKIAPGGCGCGIADTDTDGDGTADCDDLCPDDVLKIAPGDCGCGIADTDTDGDGTPDCDDLCPDDPNKIAPGDCGCGIADTDTDGDGVADCNDNCVYAANPGQEDCDNNDIGDVCEAFTEDAYCAQAEAATLDCICTAPLPTSNAELCAVVIACIDAAVASVPLCDPAACKASILTTINTAMGTNCQ